MKKERELINIKTWVGTFHEEVKSNSVTDFIVWIDCKLELINQRRKEMELQKPKRVR